MAELNQCNQEQATPSVPEGMIPFVVYGYPMMGTMMPPMFNMDRCGMYGTVTPCMPQMNVKNPVFFQPYQRPGCGCGCGVSDLENH